MPKTLTDSDYESFLKEHKNTLVYFTASWCGPCKKMKPHYEKAALSLQELAPGLECEFVLIDVDASPSAASVFGIECMPTLVLVKDGEIVARNQGAIDCTQILGLIEKYYGTESFSTVAQVTKNVSTR